ncbi:GNAT family N-acetyltransferase [Paenibacillus sp. SYP-B3998]|uniref:GNAT family N-acetyltransferase n=1 Tax=Paenibacillus sp. SYP-B3998 TaxID=2678564 RepID=A0A6G4A4I9_9BACL|nr:GNAT family N-acetyltransferase [Paenibacillus sp. SYP-B3998]NEW08729.1 GNAT family N-acetyltransferase [Paenibacillus sp. SYP-B3998]
MIIRQALTETDVLNAFDIEQTVYSSETAASLEAFMMRKENFSLYFLVAETSHRQIIGVTNSVKLQHIHLTDESIKQSTASTLDGAYLCILTIAVHPAHQRKGVASLLLQQVIQLARRDLLKGIVLMCEEHLIEFYEKHGFVYISPSTSEHGGIKWHEMSLIWDV